MGSAPPEAGELMALDIVTPEQCDRCNGRSGLVLCEACFAKWSEEMTKEVMEVNERYFDPIGGYRWSR
jgi:hypothetical protein